MVVARDGGAGRGVEGEEDMANRQSEGIKFQLCKRSNFWRSSVQHCARS